MKHLFFLLLLCISVSASAQKLISDTGVYKYKDCKGDSVTISIDKDKWKLKTPGQYSVEGGIELWQQIIALLDKSTGNHLAIEELKKIISDQVKPQIQQPKPKN